MEEFLRSLFLSLSKNKRANELAKQYGLRFGADKFVAGETIESAMAKVQELYQQGIAVTLDHLGEFVSDEREARESTEYCLDTLDAIFDHKVNVNLSVKLTQLGLDIDPGLCKNHLRQILERAKEYDLFVRVDMEDFGHLAITLEIVEDLRHHFHNVGTVIQSYLYRSEEDARHLVGLGIPLRIVKGAYKEPREIAYPDKTDVDENYKKLVQISLDTSDYTAIATHDEKIIEWVKNYVREENIRAQRYEFQMLYGIRASLQHQLVKEGYPVRIYVPFGNDWYGYFMRRLAERPANVAFVARGIARG